MAAEQAEAAEWLGVPLVADDTIIGALVIHGDSATVNYGRNDLRVLQRLAPSIVRAMERKKSEQVLRHMAHHDALTGLPNRPLFNDRFDVALRRAARHGEYLGLLYLDLNGFKQINDIHRHEAGDQLLRDFSQRLLKRLRDSDTVARMGGDEFTILLTSVHSPDCSRIVADKVRAALAEPFDLDGEPLLVSASIGTAIFPNDGHDREALLRAANVAMYSLKPEPGSPPQNPHAPA